VALLATGFGAVRLGLRGGLDFGQGIAQVVVDAVDEALKLVKPAQVVLVDCQCGGHDVMHRVAHTCGVKRPRHVD
jgi:hypothetical protein